MQLVQGIVEGSLLVQGIIRSRQVTCALSLVFQISTAHCFSLCIHQHIVSQNNLYNHWTNYQLDVYENAILFKILVICQCDQFHSMPGHSNPQVHALHLTLNSTLIIQNMLLRKVFLEVLVEFHSWRNSTKCLVTRIPISFPFNSH